MVIPVDATLYSYQMKDPNVFLELVFSDIINNDFAPHQWWEILDLKQQKTKIPEKK